MSKSNDYEVQMGCDLVMHLLKQGVYNKEGDIVILVSRLTIERDQADHQCAYLGYVSKPRVY